MNVSSGATCTQGSGDCADDNPAVHPGGRELCNGFDENCDGHTDEPLQDAHLLSLDKPAPGHTSLHFALVDGSGTCDVIRGGLIALVSSHGDFSRATNACLASDTNATSLEDNELPAASDGYWYLIRVQRATGNHPTYDAEVCHQAASRDSSIAASPAACP
ncbi:MAG TPA: putative metal-binding motif-containing protein [Candidatus Polarisedimenticolaceae bacterium]|nr:putative metal-binding motif-containing protein [Candidatus Polarisedimenticolaceae bacterium]